MDNFVPRRRCIACMQSKPKDELLRFSIQGSGRGKYICNNQACIELAIKKKRINREDLLNANKRENG
ncbi:MAG: YlxR family protein [Bacillota bacterium]|nr:YlxR family protein [Bacillota bacterium]